MVGFVEPIASVLGKKAPAGFCLQVLQEARDQSVRTIFHNRARESNRLSQVSHIFRCQREEPPFTPRCGINDFRGLVHK
jgi:hypothetical protein